MGNAGLNTISSFHSAGFSGRRRRWTEKNSELTDPQHSAQSYEVTLGRVAPSSAGLSFLIPEGRDNHLMCFSGPERGLHEIMSLKHNAQCSVSWQEMLMVIFKYFLKFFDTLLPKCI